MHLLINSIAIGFSRIDKNIQGPKKEAGVSNIQLNPLLPSIDKKPRLGKLLYTVKLELTQTHRCNMYMKESYMLRRRFCY